MSMTTFQTRTSGTIEFACPENVGPVGVFRSSAAAGRCLESWKDLLEDDDVTGSIVFPVQDNLSRDRRPWFVAALTYNRPVRR